MELYISLLFDVEDLLSDGVDDVTAELAQLASSTGVSATFCIVGERVRQWRERGRNDVVEALACHDIGYHTNFHSMHPTVVEYLGDKSWGEGVAESLKRERPGFLDLVESFGVTPSCWGGPGNTWGPQINEVATTMGIPAIVYAHTRTPGGDVHKFAGSIMYPGGMSVGDGDYHIEERWCQNLQLLLDGLEANVVAGVQWTEVFMGHPSRILHDAFWDATPFGAGNTLPQTEWKRPGRKSDTELKRALTNVRRTIDELRGMSGIEILTIRQMNTLFEKATEVALEDYELRVARKVTDNNLRSMADWPILPPGIDTGTIRRHTAEKLEGIRKLVFPANTLQ